ncbi:MAG: peptidoglycan-binding protein [Cellvibrionales bacterium]|nr:peptidoglycan-binding protein [Cellvibrionales bacterium]
MPICGGYWCNIAHWLSSTDCTHAPLSQEKKINAHRKLGRHTCSLLVKTLGFLPENANVTTLYDGAVVEGVKQFQQQHGQIPDGVLGKQTYDNLRITILIE